MNDRSERFDFGSMLVPEVGSWNGMRITYAPWSAHKGIPIKVRVRHELAWLMPDGRAVLERRALPHLKRTFIHLMTLRIHGAELRWWM